MKALVLIECQNEWLSPKGKLQKLIEDKEMFNHSIANIEKVLKFARKNNMPIAHVGLRFQKGYPELANGKSGLHKVIPLVGTFPQSGFSGSNLDIWLRNNKIEDIYLVGYATHVCVESTLRDAHDKGYNTFLISDATSAFNRMQQDYVLNEIVHHFGEHLPTEKFINA